MMKVSAVIVKTQGKVARKTFLGVPARTIRQVSNKSSYVNTSLEVKAKVCTVIAAHAFASQLQPLNAFSCFPLKRFSEERFINSYERLKNKGNKFIMNIQK